MSLNSWRGSFQAHDFKHTTLATKLGGDVLTHQSPHLEVVGTNIGRKLLRVGLTVEHNDGNTLVIHLIDSRRDGCFLIRRHYQQVNPLFDEVLYLLYLLLVTVIGRGKPKLHAIMEIGTHPQFVVKLVPPNVLRALRNAYHEARFLF